MAQLTIDADRRAVSYTPNVYGGCGIPGGIRARLDTSKFLYPEDFGAVKNDGTDCTDALQTCAANMVTDGVIKLSAGTYRISSFYAPIQSQLKSNFTLRGAKDAQGRPLTRLDVRGGVGIAYGFNFNNWSSEYNPRGPITGGMSRGSTVLTVPSSGPYYSFHGGGMARIEMANSTDPAAPVIAVLGSLKLVSFSVRVMAVAGNQITIDPPLPMDLDPALSPELVEAEPSGNTNVPEFVGFEDLIIDGSVGNAMSAGIIGQVSYAHWLKNVHIKGHTQRAFFLADEVYTEIRHCRIGTAENAGSGTAGILYNTMTNGLVEDNILTENQSLIQINFGTIGCAVTNNFFHRGTAALNIDVCHQAHPSRNIIEDNYSPTYMADSYWGSSEAATLHRNWISAINDLEDPDGLYSKTYCLSENRLARKTTHHGNIYGSPGYAPDTPYSPSGKPNMVSPHSYGTADHITAAFFDIDPTTKLVKGWRVHLDSGEGTTAGQMTVHVDDAADFLEHMIRAASYAGDETVASGGSGGWFAGLSSSLCYSSSHVGRVWQIVSAGSDVLFGPGDYVVRPGAGGFQEQDNGVAGTSKRKGNFLWFENGGAGGIPASEALAGGETYSPGYVNAVKPSWWGSSIWPPFDATNPPSTLTAAVLSARLPAAYRFFHADADAPGASAGGDETPPAPPPSYQVGHLSFRR